MLRRSIATACSAALLFGAPATALAQSAGDNQYQDPLAGGGSSGGSSSHQGGGSGSSSGARGGSTGSRAAGTSSAPSTGTGTTAQTEASTAPQAANQLPRTGGEPIVLVYLGVASLALGGGIRLLVPQRP